MSLLTESNNTIFLLDLAVCGQHVTSCAILRLCTSAVTNYWIWIKSFTNVTSLTGTALLEKTVGAFLTRATQQE